MSSEVSKPKPQIRMMFDRKGRVYEPTVGPKLRFLLVVIFVLFAILGANGAYLGTITLAQWWTGHQYEQQIYQYQFLGHLVLGFLFIPPVLFFVGCHLKTALGRPNRRAVRMGFGLLIMGVLLIASGVVMIFMRGLFDTKTIQGRLVYWIHVLTPVGVIVFYILHRLAGPKIKWHYAKGWGIAVAVIIALFAYFHFQNPLQWNVPGANPEYFYPSDARTLDEKGDSPFIPAYTMMNDSYCLKCHPDAYAGWFHSAHHFSSFNNLAYRQSILDMRKALDAEVHQVAVEKKLPLDGTEFKAMRAKKLQATRWCAGCHDPVPFFSGAFDDDSFFKDLEINFPLDGSKGHDPSLTKQPTAHAGLTCVSCHGITHVNTLTGNASYTIQQVQAYPFTYSENKFLQGINEYLVKSKPDFHKKSMMKPFMRTAEFCQVCHKVSLPEPVNSYKWTRGQNHYDSWHASGASGFGARSFYSPLVAKQCAECHMPLMDSKDFGNINGQIHNHLWLGANTALPKLRLHAGERNYYAPIGDENDVIRLHEEFLKDKKIRVDLFAVREKGEVDGELKVIRPFAPTLTPGKSYLLEVVIRNLGVGHEFSQGTTDSNEIWVHIEAKSGDKVIASNGDIDPHGYVDARAHYLNNLILDREGRRIDRRNAKDIFVPLYTHQIPPSGSQLVHYRFTVPNDQKEPIEFNVHVKYRKFDKLYQDFFTDRKRPQQAASLLGINPFGALGLAKVHETNRDLELPIVILAEDMLELPVSGNAEAAVKPIPQWERYNDYGISLLLQGDEGADRGLLKQAEAAFLEVTKLNPKYVDGFLNLVRVYLKEGRLADAAAMLAKAEEVQPGFFRTAWLRGQLNRRNGHLAEAAEDFRGVLNTKIPEKKFDFSLDREIRRELADTLFRQAQQATDDSPEQKALLNQAVEEFAKVLAIDPEDRMTHYLLHQVYKELGDTKASEAHLGYYKIYEVDNSARDHAVRTFRKAHAWADRAAQAVVIYELKPK